MKKTLLVAAVAAAALAGAPAASAAILVATFTGTVNDSVANDFGLFGGGDLTGDAFVARYTFDTAKGDYSTSGGYEHQEGGSLSGGFTPPVTATLTINGATQSFDGTYASGVRDFPGDAYLQYFSGYRYSDATIFSRHIVNLLANYGTPSIFSTISLTDVPISGIAFFESGNRITGDYLSTYLDLTGPGTLIVTGGVPEPATWALMISGFGIAGAALRRRRAAVAA